QQRGQHHDHAQRQRQMPGRTDVEDVPGRGTDRAFDHQGHRQAVQPQPEQQPDQAFRQAARAQLGQGPQGGEGEGGVLVHGQTLAIIGLQLHSQFSGGGLMERTLDAGRLATLLGSFDRSPAYRGLYLALQELIGDGRIPIGTRLPSERAVAAALGLSRITVARAYADLAEAGFAQARQGSGTYAAVPIDRRRAHDHALRPLLDGDAMEGAIDLNCAATAASPGLAAAYERALAALPAYLGGDGYLPSGLPALRARIAASYAERGLPTSTEQIVITSGALSALAILARALSGPGDRIMIESPVYPNAMEALKAGGGRLVASPLADPLGEEGWDHVGIEATLRQASPRLAYLIPDFQNPTGFLMDEAGRERYARSLHAAGTTAIIDET